MPAPLGKRVDTLFQEQSTFGAYPTGAWQPLTVYSAGAGETRNFVDDPVLGRTLYNGRDPGEPAPSLPTCEGPVETPLCLREIGYWLKMALGAPTTTGSTDKSHVFESGKDVLPAFTLQHRLAASDYRRVRGLKVNTMDIRAEKTDGFPRVTFGLMGRDEALNTAALSGSTSAALALLRPAASRPIVRWAGAAAADCLAASMSFSNSLEKLNDLNGTEYPSDIDPGFVTLSGDLTLRYRDQTWAAIAAAETVGRLELEWAMPGALAATRKITFDMPNARIARQGMPVQGPGTITATYRYAAFVSATDPALKVTLLNDVASY